MGEAKTFYCLRCQHRFPVADYDPKQVAERACPKCGSNSVRPAPAAPADRAAAKSQRGGSAHG